jgi:hypothetical protein
VKSCNFSSLSVIREGVQRHPFTVYKYVLDQWKGTTSSHSLFTQLFTFSLFTQLFTFNSADRALNSDGLAQIGWSKRAQESGPRPRLPTPQQQRRHAYVCSADRVRSCGAGVLVARGF